MTETEKFRTVMVNGAKCYCDKLISKDGAIIFASFFGTEANVSTVSYSLLSTNISKNGTNILEIGRGTYERMHNISYRLKTQRLQHNTVHAIVYSKQHFLMQDACCCIFGDTDQEVAMNYYNVLSSKTTVPLHHAWAEYLFGISEIYTLDTFNCGPAYEVFLLSDEKVKSSVMDNIEYLSRKVMAA